MLARDLDRSVVLAQDQGVSLCESSSADQDDAPLLAWDERALMDWEGGIVAAVHDWMGPQGPAPDRKALNESLARADASARASRPACFLELMRRVYLCLAQDLAFAPRQLDLLELETRLRSFLPRAGVVERLRALRRAGMRLAWVQESGGSIAGDWRAQVGVPFDEIIELGPVHRCLKEMTARAISREADGGQAAVILVSGPGRVRSEDAFSKTSSTGLAGELCWPNQDAMSFDCPGISEHWQRRVSELLS